uniref:Rapunzel 6 n=1 Tax=Oryzias latipes TaxID=8090 RepID=A0A3P9IC36_ORYLA
MASSLEKAVAQKKGIIEAMIDMLEKGTEVLASNVGDLSPFCEVTFPVVKLALGKVQSQEVLYVKEQFLIVKNKLDLLSSQQIDINIEIKKANLDSQYFSVEENIRNQFRKFVDFLEAQEQFREVKKDIFLKHFSKSGGEKNLWTLHNAVMGTSILEVVESYVARNRRLLEDYCARLKELICLGLIALMGHRALTAESEEEQEQEVMQEWRPKIEEIEYKMKSVIESCIAAFPEQAQLDVKRLLQEKEEGNLQLVAEELLEFLVKKFDWVCWSVRLIKHPDGFFKKHSVGKPFHHVAGQTQFEVVQENNISLVVSYSTNPKPVPGDVIQQLMEGQGKKGSPPAVVEMLEKQLCGFIIHVVSSQSKSECVWSFPEDCHYWEKHKNGVVCVHSE